MSSEDVMNIISYLCPWRKLDAITIVSAMTLGNGMGAEVSNG
jgi:hypothetical protein